MPTGTEEIRSLSITIQKHGSWIWKFFINESMSEVAHNFSDYAMLSILYSSPISCQRITMFLKKPYCEKTWYILKQNFVWKPYSLLPAHGVRECLRMFAKLPILTGQLQPALYTFLGQKKYKHWLNVSVFQLCTKLFFFFNIMLTLT